MAPQDVLGVLEIGQDLAHFAPEVLAVVHFAQVGQLVRDHVVDDGRREVDQAPVQHDVAVAGARAPAGRGGRQPPAADLQAADLQEMRQARAEPGAGALLQPGLGGVADAALVGVGGQGQPQRVAVRGASASPERSLAAVAAHADDDAPAQIRQLAAGLPARVRHGQLPLAGVPFAQLVQDPAGFLAHRVVDLGVTQLGAVTRRPSSVMTKPMLRRRERSSKADGLFVGVHLAPAAPGGSGSGQGVGTRAEAFGDSVSSGSPEWAGDGSGRRAGDGASGAGAVRASRAARRPPAARLPARRFPASRTGVRAERC